MTRRVKELKAGDRIEVDAITAPDGSERLPIYEEVVYIEDVGRCFRVHTASHVFTMNEDTEVDAEE